MSELQLSSPQGLVGRASAGFTWPLFWITISVLIGVPASAQCEWDSAFSSLGPSDRVEAAIVFDDGHGPALYVGGRFETSDDVVTGSLARWNGSAWEAVPGAPPDIEALVIFDDGTGPTLYAGVPYPPGVFRWEAPVWQPAELGVAGPSTSVKAFAVYDDGSGSALYAGGEFTSAGGEAASNIARWDGVSWSPLGSGTGGPIHALAVHDDGRGQRLFAGGLFEFISGDPATNGLAAWDGASWSAVGAGLNGFVRTFEIFSNGGDSPVLIAGGNFGPVGGAGPFTAAWNGVAWSELGNGPGGEVRSLARFTDGNDDVLLAVTGIGTHSVKRWDGAAWTSLGGDLEGAHPRVIIYDDGLGASPVLYGNFSPGTPSGRVLVWRNDAWRALGNSTGQGINETVRALLTREESGQEVLYAGGWFSEAGGGEAHYIARWDGVSWSSVGPGLKTSVASLVEFDGDLYAGLDYIFETVDDDTVWRWDGVSWSQVGGALLGEIKALAVFDDGDGPALYAARFYQQEGGLYRLDGASWTNIATFEGNVLHLAVFDDGDGPRLFAGGTFGEVNGLSVDHIAAWDGTAWSAVGSGLKGIVTALQVFDDGDGPAIWAGWLGPLSVSPPRGASRWDGQQWQRVDAGMPLPSPSAFTVVGDELFAFNHRSLYRWGGEAWQLASAAVDLPVQTLAAYDVDGDGSEPAAIFAGGRFTVAGGKASTHIGRCFFPTPIFADGFESGDFSAWSTSTGAGPIPSSH
ncbi:MAG: hypothetical protein AAGM22_16735 [Acidobacteriota bacterium]